jgi:hypothetical protein
MGVSVSDEPLVHDKFIALTPRPEALLELVEKHNASRMM